MNEEGFICQSPDWRDESDHEAKQEKTADQQEETRAREKKERSKRNVETDKGRKTK